MGSFTFNVAKGKIARYIDLPNPPNVMRWMLLQNAGLESDSAMQDRSTWSDILTGSTEASFIGYVTGQGLLSTTCTANISNTFNANFITDTVNPLWSASTVQTIGKIVLVYDPSGNHQAPLMIPMFADDFVDSTGTVITTIPGSTISYGIAPSGFCVAT